MILFSVVFSPVNLNWQKLPQFREDKDNYRPISVLSILSKIFEKAMFKRLYGYLESRIS